VGERHWPRLDLVLDHLRRQGYLVEEGSLVRRRAACASGSARERADELMAALLRADVDAVLPPWGGELALELLELLDWDALTRTRPKWLVGFSDLSTLMLPLLLRSGWASAHGPNLMDRAPSQVDALTSQSWSLLSTAAGESFEQRSSLAWQKHFVDFTTHPDAAFALTEPTRWRALFGEATVCAQGRVLGGCLDTWVNLVGTPYGDLRAWRARAPDEGCLLWLENCELPPASLVRALRQLRYAGWLDGLSALLLGRSAAERREQQGLSYEAALACSLEGLGCPVLFDVDFGHQPPQMSLVQGALGELRWDGETARFVQRLV
jgi:muramoyltetrapeptide carboxypeptidase